jgi:hypothetical protein
MSFINYHQTKGHVFGECMSKLDSELMYVHIPKNATSWTKPNLLDWDWEFFNYHTDNLKNKTALVVLRDPIDRWISGIAEYLYLYHPNIDLVHTGRAFFDLVFDKITFDDHTEKQVYFVEGLNLSQCVFFKCGPDYRQQFSQFLAEHGMPNRYNNYNYQHVSDDSPERKRFKKIFTDQLKNSKYLNQLQDYFKQDYELIEQVKFYGTR